MYTLVKKDHVIARAKMGVEHIVRFSYKSLHTMLKDKMISPIIWRAMSTMKFGLDQYSTPMRIEKIKICPIFAANWRDR